LIWCRWRLGWGSRTRRCLPILFVDRVAGDYQDHPDKAQEQGLDGQTSRYRSEYFGDYRLHGGIGDGVLRGRAHGRDQQ
jgi:hypothetical protein